MLALQAHVYHFIPLTLYYRVKAFNFDKIQVTDFSFIDNAKLTSSTEDFKISS